MSTKKMNNGFFKGVDFRNPNLTRDGRIWFRYLCWFIQIKMSDIHWTYPLFIRVWILGRFNRDICYLPGKQIWEFIRRWFRGIAGCSHRCEFTDPQEGALYGGTNGAFMDKLFEELIRRIERG